MSGTNWKQVPPSRLRPLGVVCALSALGLLAPASLAAPWQGEVPEVPPAPEVAAPAEAVEAAETAPAPPKEQMDESPELPELIEEGFPIHGSLRARVRTRTTTDEDDTDLFATLRLDFGDVDRYGFSGHLSAIGLADLDGTDDGEYAFFGVYDTYDSSVQGRLHLAYLDLPEPGSLEMLRLGRQQVYTTPEFAWFDGLRVETGSRADQDIIFGGYAGLPVRPYQSSTDAELLGGLYTEFHPWEDGRVRVDYMRFEDESLIGNGGNDLWNFELRQELMPGLDFDGAYSRLDSVDRNAKLGLTSYGLAKDLVLRASWFELLEPQGTLANELDPFTSSTFELQPYSQGRFLASKGIGESLVLEAGFDVRRVTEDVDVGEFNRDFERYFLRSTFIDVADSGFDVTATAEALRGESEIETWGLDAEKELTDRLELAFGSYYSLYKYDLFLDAERDDVRSYHVDLRYAWRDDLSLDLDYVFEDDDLDNQHTIRFGMRWSF